MSAATPFPNLDQLFADLHARSCAIANRERVDKTWPFITPEYAEHCAEHYLNMDDPDSIDHFVDFWEPAIGDVGICGSCGYSCRARFETTVDHIPYGERTITQEWQEYLGSDCCGATIYDAAGKEI